MDGEPDGPISVTRALEDAKLALGSLPILTVAGEVTGFRGPNARSGHCYFQVKDEQSAMDVIVWRGTYAKCGFELRDGLTVQITGAFDVYTGSGRMSFVARKIEASGEGLLRQQVAALARKLQQEGLMDPARKRPIPRFCTRVAVVTSLSGSVIDDVKRTLARRNPLVELQVVGCQVQGPGAPATIRYALGVAASAVPDAILLVRGGGSFEDLMTFNDEGLARAVAACPVPVITGIGHEPDTSICDMVADRRCSTPTAAAESVAPAIDELAQKTADRQTRLAASMGRIVEQQGQLLQTSSERMGRAMGTDLSRRRMAVEALATRRCLTEPLSLVSDRQRTLDLTEERLMGALPRSLAMRRDALDATARRVNAAGARLTAPHEARLAKAAASLDALSPLKVLARGYAITRDAEGHVVSDASTLSEGDKISVLLGAGTVNATVTSTQATTTV
ncbi:MAG: exodeoxyribonuclease VII large subunit [Atopobiaceae bacterium]|nr:exodeoxyribonuclease VII large subunit [Atopobiaceae bacterium]